MQLCPRRCATIQAVYDLRLARCRDNSSAGRLVAKMKGWHAFNFPFSKDATLIVQHYSDFQVGRYDILLQTTIHPYYVISYQTPKSRGNIKKKVYNNFVHLLHPSLASLTCESAVTLEVWFLPKALHCFAAWRHRRQQFPRFVAYVANQLHLLLAVLHPKKTMYQTYLVTEVCIFTSAYYFHFDLKLRR